MTTLLNLLLFPGASLMTPGCGVVAFAMLFSVFSAATITKILYVLTGDIDCVQMSCYNYLVQTTTFSTFQETIITVFQKLLLDLLFL